MYLIIQFMLLYNKNYAEDICVFCAVKDLL